MNSKVIVVFGQEQPQMRANATIRLGAYQGHHTHGPHRGKRRQHRILSEAGHHLAPESRQNNDQPWGTFPEHQKAEGEESKPEVGRGIDGAGPYRLVQSRQ